MRSMLRPLSLALAGLLWIAAALPAAAVELLMVEQKGCYYCRTWNATIAPIYPKTPEGQFAPLRRADLREGPPEGVTYARGVNYTPTFILLDDGKEIGRIEGYPGEDFFWGLLQMMLKDKTDFQGAG